MTCPEPEQETLLTRHRNLWRLLAALFAVSLLAAACGGDDAADDVGDTDTGDGDTSEPAEDFEISYGIVEPTWIDSFNVQDSEGFEVARLLFDGLTDLNEDLEAIPAVATEWESDDNLTWTFTLRDDVTFHNGEAVTAQSFVDAWNRVADPEMASDEAMLDRPIARARRDAHGHIAVPVLD
ncbi:MAG: hypothetical protein JJE52_09590 [Acidimicrobiia bacterium]|nr:hypothetical protein [Acidimicrobiia bacterium]